MAHLVLDFDHELLQSKYERSEYDIAQLLQAEMSLKQQLLSAQEELTQMQMSTLTESRVFQEMKVFLFFLNPLETKILSSNAIM